MKVFLCVSISLLFILASVATSQCQGDSLVDNVKTVDGTVASVDSQNSQIVVKSFEAMTFSVPTDARIINADGFAIRLSDVNVGNYVSVGYSSDKSGNHILSSMEVDYNR